MNDKTAHTQTDASSSTSQLERVVGDGRVRASYTSPFPVSSEMRACEEILPGAADRMMKFVENEQESRIRDVEARRENVQKLNLRGQTFSLVIILISLLVAGIAVCLKEQTSVCALAAVSGSLGYLIFHEKSKR